MKNKKVISVRWLTNEDKNCFGERVSRLQWIASIAPKAEYWTFPGGLVAKSLFEESRYCFVYGQFLAAVLLGLAYIEITLAALFYGNLSRDDLERASFLDLLKQALDMGLINQNEFEDLERARQNRNTYVHFRRPGHNTSLEYRAVNESELPYNRMAQDATTVMASVFRLVAKNSI